MTTLQVLEETKENIFFELELQNNIKLKIEVLKKNPFWIFEFWIKIPIHGHFRFEYEEEYFVPIFHFEERVKKLLSRKTLKEIDKGFKEVFFQLKKHPSYRLKVIHVLNDELREIWDNV